ncbi:protein of unknown function DUF305 [Fibrisoma limi BUZ 3]|uniref:Uncharacterized protein n=1 Tax=Fibrisoma limi BUZ 3 TaxID=1185876 RepID=I2GCR4_9BACT|nr:DUF305 domain-containing protein [Fibrisoma limi]CCH51688.1 protein of unknown function DUF305 [Fibrisoma limi BUZ 3]
MKLIKNTSFHIVGVALLLTAGLLNACAQSTTLATRAARAGAKVSTDDPAKTPLLQPMRQMMDKIKKLQTTGDPDFDYAFRAKVHTQGAIDLLNQEIQNGKNDSLKQAAKTMLTTAQADMAAIDGLIRQIKPNRPNQAFVQQQSRNTEAMALKMQQGGAEDKLSDNFDKNFAILYQEHRQDAIDMANTYLQYGNNSALKSFAQQLVTKAQQNIEQLKAMVK